MPSNFLNNYEKQKKKQWKKMIVKKLIFNEINFIILL